MKEVRDDALRPSTRLRTRVTAFFLLAGTPAVLLFAVAGVLLDRLVTQEISARTQETEAELARIVDAERGRIERALDSLVEDEEVRALASGVDALDLGGFEGLAARLAPVHGLDLLAFVPARGPHARTLVSSAHLPTAVGDDAPPFVTPMRGAPRTPAAYAQDWAEGNPPALTPSLVAGRTISRRGDPALVVYGGARLAQRLAHVARAGQATFILRAPGIDPVVFPKDGLQNGRARALEIPGLPGGAGDGRVQIFVHTARLEAARELVRKASFVAAGAAMLAALLAGTFLSRRLTQPIAELAEAAREVGAGRLDVELAPRSRDEVGTLVRVFNRMTKELADSRVRLARAERVAAWQQIARRVAHEIKNPLFPIQMSIETLKKSYAKGHPKLDEIVEESTRTVLEEVRALNRIVTEFSDFARLPTPQRAPELVRGLLEHVHALYAQGGPEQAKVRLVVPDEDLPALFVDKAQVCRALINLVKNAIEASGPEGQVTLRASSAARNGIVGAWLEVEDDGPGIPEDVRIQLFTPYFTTKQTGSGLGLAIVDRIAQEHGGEVEVLSEVGRGTTMRMWLPAAT